MAAKVYDFKTGQLCKCCTLCKCWKVFKDFPEDVGEPYSLGPVCSSCVALGDPVDFIFTMEPDDEAA